MSILLLSACELTSDASIVEISGSALEPVTLDPMERRPAAEAVWEATTIPSDGATGALRVVGDTAVLEPAVRGTYVIDRWLELGASERLTHRFVVTVPGVPGIPRISAPASASLGEQVAASAELSSSPEGLSLRYQWRLAERPRDSAASLNDDRELQTGFVADVVGEFVIALSVFDGQLWSAETTRLIDVP